jgi:sulfur-carrier protein adenylyltransferase/sulfurtransferase
MERYSRHLRIPEIGELGQRSISNARILVIGSGGLGSPSLMYLAAAGVGTIGIVDHDVVDITNLQRQVLFAESSVGSSKAVHAGRRIRELNSEINVVVFDTYLSSENALEIFADFDVVIDATDNFATRYLINDACVLLGIPYVWGSILRFDGQISIFGMVNGPCYRCVYPQPPEPGTIPSCADAGVLGSVCGVIGSMQATAALNLVMGIGDSLAGSIGIFNALDMSFEKVPVQRNPHCMACGDTPSLTELIDYAVWCSASDNSIPIHELRQLIAERESGATDFTLVDVRESGELLLGQIPGSMHLPMSALADSNELVVTVREACGPGPLIFYCKSGYRSGILIEALTAQGGEDVRHYPGGFDEWNSQA